jgi:hypothetical protein
MDDPVWSRAPDEFLKPTRFAIDHYDFSAGRLCRQRTHHSSSDLPRATDDQREISFQNPATLMQ